MIDITVIHIDGVDYGLPATVAERLQKVVRDIAALEAENARLRAENARLSAELDKAQAASEGNDD
jgi:cell division protein FtsB